MVLKVKVKDNQFDADIVSRIRDSCWDFRASKEIALVMDYDTAVATFTDDTQWSTIYRGADYYDPETQQMVTPEPVETDCSDYCILGDITVHRDGTVTVKMGKPLPGETLSTLTGGATPTNAEVKAMRASMETMYQSQSGSMTTDQQISNRFMSPVWKAGNHTVGEIYCTTPDSIWKCRQSYNNDVYPDIKPDSSAWYTFNIPLHGTTPETALPFVLPKEAESRYKTGEYMIYNGSTYMCVRDTAYSPDDDAQAWSKM